VSRRGERDSKLIEKKFGAKRGLSREENVETPMNLGKRCRGVQAQGPALTPCEEQLIGCWGRAKLRHIG